MLGDVVTMTYDEDKLTELILYVAKRTSGDRSSGATKLNKYLYFADFAAVRTIGRPITGAEYQKLPHGPAPRRLPPIRKKLVANGEVRIEERADAFGYVHHVLVPLREPRVELFTPEEIDLVDGVIEALRDLSVTQVSVRSHIEAGWQLVEEGETIPYELAFVLAPTEADPTPSIRTEGERLLALYASELA